MAKKTKESNLSIEERLEQALIPSWDEPYKLPENWCWTHIDCCCRDFFSGKSPKYSKNDTGYHIIGQQANQRYGLDLRFIKFATKEFAEAQDSRYWLQKKDVILNTLGTGSIGRSGIIKNDVNLLTDGHLLVFRTNQWVVPEYLYYFLQLTEESIIASANGSTNQKFLSLSAFSQTAIPLPPLAEQQRIVKQIETLFAKLDEAKEKAQEVIDGFETRKASILHNAFSGELTAKWREVNGVSFDSWENRSFDECIEKMQNGLAKRSGNTGIPYVVLRLANLSEDGFIIDDLREIILDEKEQKSYKLNIGDVVMVRVNGSKDNVAKQILVTENNSWAFCDHIIRIKYNESVLPEYMVLFSKSEDYKLYVKDNIVSSAGQNTISRKGMARLKIPVPSIAEQKEITNILLNLFAKEHSVKEIAEAVIDQIDTMKKAILSRAFRGELGTNDPNEESAVELLKRILESK